MDYKEWAEKEKGKAIEERKKLESIEAEKINMESKAKKQKSSTGEKIAKAIMIFSAVIVIAALITIIAYDGVKSAPLLAKIVIYAGVVSTFLCKFFIERQIRMHLTYFCMSPAHLHF